jgi:cilia- and flagella-associated protein 52
VWSATTFQELLRIIVPNFICATITFARDGKSIMSGWNDGAIRAFTPLSGKLIFTIPNAHNKGCSALALTSNCRTLVSAGIEGQVRVWKIDASRQQLIGVLKDHSPYPVVSVEINIFDNEVLTAATDGVCIMWDLM